MITALIYDSADDIETGAPAELTQAVADGARYFYSVPDTGGSWYVLLATDVEMTEDQVQLAWDEMQEED